MRHLRHGAALAIPDVQEGPNALGRSVFTARHHSFHFAHSFIQQGTQRSGSRQESQRAFTNACPYSR